MEEESSDDEINTKSNRKQVAPGKRSKREEDIVIETHIEVMESSLKSP